MHRADLAPRHCSCTACCDDLVREYAPHLLSEDSHLSDEEISAIRAVTALKPSLPRDNAAKSGAHPSPCNENPRRGHEFGDSSRRGSSRSTERTSA